MCSLHSIARPLAFAKSDLWTVAASVAYSGSEFKGLSPPAFLKWLVQNGGGADSVGRAASVTPTDTTADCCTTDDGIDMEDDFCGVCGRLRAR